VQPCPNECSHRGVCHGDKCYCPAGYTGDACQTKVLAAKWARTARYGASAALTPDDRYAPVENINPETGLNDGPNTRFSPGLGNSPAGAVEGGRVYDFAKLGRTAFLQMGSGERAPPAKPSTRHEGIEAMGELEGGAA
jgi:hypothetical protein